MLEEDFIMRMIHEMVTTLLKLIFHIELGENEELNFKDQETVSKYQELLALIQAGNINEAENKLLDELDSKDMEHFKMALMFYYHLNQVDYSFLEDHDFSKNEITDGLRYVSSIYGYDSMAEAFWAEVNRSAIKKNRLSGPLADIPANYRKFNPLWTAEKMRTPRKCCYCQHLRGVHILPLRKAFKHNLISLNFKRLYYKFKLLRPALCHLSFPCLKQIAFINPFNPLSHSQGKCGMGFCIFIFVHTDHHLLRSPPP